MTPPNLQSRGIFPPELVDSIIDHNHSDPPTLMACALVSNNWVPSSRYHLFSTVAISHTNAREFIELLSSPLCTISTAVQGMDVQFVPGSQRWFAEFTRRMNSLNKITIQSLGILGSGNTVIREEVQTAIPALAPQTKIFNVGPSVIFGTFSQFAKLLCTFDTLESLSCGCTFQNKDRAHGLRFKSPLRQVHLVTPAIKAVSEFLLAQGVLPTVSSLSLSHLVSDDYPTLTTFLAIPNDNLQSLAIKMNTSFSGTTLDSFTEAVKLTQLKALLNLSIETDPKLSPEQVSRLLEQITSDNLKSVEITMALEQGAGRVDVLLSGKFPLLTKVKIVGSAWGDARQFLPRCNAKNILQE
ncbi:hypothetical protein JR316_0011445 [Psilocybe cubensis]|uniref:Uncharacterized protein n=2 Tax=Psilocybe cubensis TaxID=181762 RepID=A0ACB8GJW5_PSICU|nr:hypothetical protein JR316_0011445 [Psilocybe cubensis]KAH9475884.1 hypothetical protein JR316_0011445 [Psilocybe cubensis]